MIHAIINYAYTLIIYSVEMKILQLGVHTVKLCSDNNSTPFYNLTFRSQTRMKPGDNKSLSTLFPTGTKRVRFDPNLSASHYSLMEAVRWAPQ